MILSNEDFFTFFLPLFREACSSVEGAELGCGGTPLRLQVIIQFRPLHPSAATASGQIVAYDAFLADAEYCSRCSYLSL